MVLRWLLSHLQPNDRARPLSSALGNFRAFLAREAAPARFRLTKWRKGADQPRTILGTVSRANLANSLTHIARAGADEAEEPDFKREIFSLQANGGEPGRAAKSDLRHERRRFQGGERTQEGLNGVDLGDIARPDLVLATDRVRHPAHDESIGELEDALLVQFETSTVRRAPTCDSCAR